MFEYMIIDFVYPGGETKESALLLFDGMEEVSEEKFIFKNLKCLALKNNLIEFNEEGRWRIKAKNGKKSSSPWRYIVADKEDLDSAILKDVDNEETARLMFEVRE